MAARMPPPTTCLAAIATNNPFTEDTGMSGRTYWTIIVSTFGLSFVFWWAMFYWVGVSDPTPGAAICAAVSMTGALFFLKWVLEPPREPKSIP